MYHNNNDTFQSVQLRDAIMAACSPRHVPASAREGGWAVTVEVRNIWSKLVLVFVFHIFCLFEHPRIIRFIIKLSKEESGWLIGNN